MTCQAGRTTIPALMPTKPWPAPPLLVDCFTGANARERPLRDRNASGDQGTYYDTWATEPNKTECKHGRGSCEECGTSNRRDVAHTTVGGRGVVGRLRRR